MPNKGTANNPQGVNNWQGFGAELPYGDVQKLDQLQRGVPTPGRNAPQRAKRKALRGASEPPPQAAVPSPLEAAPEAQVSAIWAQVAAIPGANELIKSLAG